MRDPERIGTDKVQIGDTVEITGGEHAGDTGNIRGLGLGGASVRLSSRDPYATDSVVTLQREHLRVTTTETIERAKRLLLEAGYTVISPVGESAVESAVEQGVWRHADDDTPCVSYPDSLNFTYTDETLTCSNHGRLMFCQRVTERTAP